MTTRTLTIVDAARSGSELPTAHHLAKVRGARVIEDKDGARKVVLADDTALGKLVRQNKISARQYEAGKLFALDWYRVNGAGVRAQSFEPPVNGGNSDHEPIGEINARRRLGHDHGRLGPQLYACLVDVCGYSRSPAAWAVGAGLNRKAGPYVIDVALNLLAHSRGLPPD